MNANAPLAQLRSIDKPLWENLLSAAFEPVAPGNSAVVQALAACLLGSRKLAVQILRDGIEPHLMSHWPELRLHAARPCDHPEDGVGHNCCKDCGRDITWLGPDPHDWIHSDEQEE